VAKKTLMKHKQLFSFEVAVVHVECASASASASASKDDVQNRSKETN
jgi:hypothetical protein